MRSVVSNLARPCPGAGQLEFLVRLSNKTNISGEWMFTQEQHSILFSSRVRLFAGERTTCLFTYLSTPPWTSTAQGCPYRRRLALTRSIRCVNAYLFCHPFFVALRTRWFAQRGVWAFDVHQRHHRGYDHPCHWRRWHRRRRNIWRHDGVLSNMRKGQDLQHGTPCVYLARSKTRPTCYQLLVRSLEKQYFIGCWV